MRNDDSKPASFLLVAAPEQFKGKMREADFIELSGYKKARIFLFNVESVTDIRDRVEAFDPVLNDQIGESASRKGNEEKSDRHALFDHQRAMEQMRGMMTDKALLRDIPDRLRKYAENQLDEPVDLYNAVFISNGLHVA